MKLYEAVNNAEWSEGAVDLFAILTRFELPDEGALVLICAAAKLVAPYMGPASAAYEFGQLVQDAQAALPPPEPPVLAVVGGHHV